jgi:hypothetical protein
MMCWYGYLGLSDQGQTKGSRAEKGWPISAAEIPNGLTWLS